MTKPAKMSALWVAMLALTPPAVAADEGFAPLPDVAMPAPVSKAVPGVRVKDRGLTDSVVGKPIYAAHRDHLGLLRYVETHDELVVLDDRHRAVKRIPYEATRYPRRGYERFIRVGSSFDGRWLWMIFPATYPDKSTSRVFDSRGKLHWTLTGTLESISPDGRRVVVSSRDGLEYKETGKKESRTFPKDLPEWHPSSACLHESGTTVMTSVGKSVITRYDREFEPTRRIRLKANCTLVGCLQEAGRTVFRCYEHRMLAGNVVITRSNLLVLDDRAREIARLPLDHLLVEYLKDGQRIMTYSQTGEVTFLDVVKGDVLYHLPSVKVGKQKTYKMTRAMSVAGAVASIWEEDVFDKHTWPPRSKSRVLLIRDMAGRVVLHEDFEVKDGNIGPPLWRRGSRLLVPWGDKIRTFEIGR